MGMIGFMGPAGKIGRRAISEKKGRERRYCGHFTVSIY